MNKSEKYSRILQTLSSKSKLKQEVYDNTKNAFELLKEVLSDFSEKCNSDIAIADERVCLKYSQRGEFDAQLKVAGDLLVFNMHSNVHQFDRDHEIWKTKYAQENIEAGYASFGAIEQPVLLDRNCAALT